MSPWRWTGLLVLLLGACTHPDTQSPDRTDWIAVPNRYATHFRVWANGDERLVLVFGHGGERDTIGVYHLGPSAQEDRDDPEATRLVRPLHRFALASTTHVPYVRTLDGLAGVIACAHIAGSLDSVLLARHRAGAIAEIATGDGLDREQLLALRPAALFVYPFGNEGSAVGAAGIPLVQVSEYLEEHPLGKAEWLRFFGVFLDAEHRADSLFTRIAERYTATTERVRTVADRPAVFFGSSWQGRWSVPPGTSYLARSIADAGGTYLFADRQAAGNIDLDVETVLDVGRKAAFWGRMVAQPPPVRCSDVGGDDSRVLQLPAFQRGGCFYGNSLESDLFGEAVLQPDVLLEDLVALLHPDRAQGHAPMYLRRAAQ